MYREREREREELRGSGRRRRSETRGRELRESAKTGLSVHATQLRGPILAPPVAKGDANVVPETEILK